MIQRMVRASKAETQVYEEVERDVNATGQAALVVVVAAVASGIGAILAGPAAVILAVVGGVIGWVAWALITYFIGKKLFATRETRVTPGEMLRTLGFANAPGVLNVLGLIPVVGGLVLVVTAIWTLVLGIIAIRSAMDFSTGRALATAAVGFIPYLIVLGIMGSLIG